MSFHLEMVGSGQDAPEQRNEEPRVDGVETRLNRSRHPDCLSSPKGVYDQSRICPGSERRWIGDLLRKVASDGMNAFRVDIGKCNRPQYLRVRREFDLGHGTSLNDLVLGPDDLPEFGITGRQICDLCSQLPLVPHPQYVLQQIARTIPVETVERRGAARVKDSALVHKRA